MFLCLKKGKFQRKMEGDGQESIKNAGREVERKMDGKGQEESREKTERDERYGRR
jgi:hypothetical protein